MDHQGSPILNILEKKIADRGEKTSHKEVRGFSHGSAVKNLPAMLEMQETRVQSPGEEDPLEEGMETHCSILAWRIPWTQEHGGLQFMESQRVRHD